MQRSKSIIDSKGNSNVPRLSSSFIYSMGDSTKSISDCPTMVSQLSLMEGDFHYDPRQSQQNTFTRQQSASQIHYSSQNPNSKKNKVLMVQSRLIGTKNISEKDEIQNEMNALLQIQKKTERLVHKQRQQRKQLAKLQKLYAQKEEEITKHQERLKTQTNSLREKINQITSDKLRLAKQKDMILSTMKNLERQRRQTQIEISNYKLEKEELINQIELFQINFKNPVAIPELQQKELKDLERQVDIINSMIKTKKAEKAHHAEIQQLLQFKINLMEQRQRLKVKNQRLKYEGMVKDLNQCVLSRNCMIKHKNYTITKLLQSQNPTLEGQKQVYGDTSDTFMHSQHQYEQVNFNEGLRMQLRDLINQHSIDGHQSSYEAIQTIVLGVNHLDQSKSIPHQDLVNLVDITLQNLTNKLVCKAKQKLNKIKDISNLAITQNK